MTEMIQTLTAKANGQLSDDSAVVFGLTKAEIGFMGMILTGVAVGAVGLDHWDDLLHPKVIIGMVLQIGGACVAFAAGRATAKKDA